MKDAGSFRVVAMILTSVIPSFTDVTWSGREGCVLSCVSIGSSSSVHRAEIGRCPGRHGCGDQVIDAALCANLGLTTSAELVLLPDGEVGIQTQSNDVWVLSGRPQVVSILLLGSVLRWVSEIDPAERSRICGLGSFIAQAERRRAGLSVFKFIEHTMKIDLLVQEAVCACSS